MAQSQILTYGVSGPGGASPITKTVLVTDQAAEQFTIAVDAGELVQAAIAWGDGALRSIFITTDKGVTLMTNSSGAPTNEKELSPDSPFSWNDLSGVSEQFSGAVTSIFLQNNETSDGTVTIFMVRDATP